MAPATAMAEDVAMAAAAERSLLEEEEEGGEGLDG